MEIVNYEKLNKEEKKLLKKARAAAGKTISGIGHQIVWNAGVLPSGIYFCRLETKNFVQTKKMLLVK